MAYYKSVFTKLFRGFFLVGTFHLLIALTYFVTFPVSQDFLANAASSMDYGTIDNSNFVFLINFFILIASIGLAMLASVTLKQLGSSKNQIKIAPLVLEPIEIAKPQITKAKQTPKKKIIIQF
ncbi:TPA: hypothetical protein DDW69_03010 [candidate division CPR2 bacterium]|uniref:Uncharacterized protein n=1 Tax=candidate division CPR2 bacterium GW2011_GWC1_41_48 TaxID=1618344 RepID=A0A0G0YHY2_UNCC2|nr:MAG: hypothetical protein UT47_C0003G0202 [candidate division CPR2 bacterium GW2011_GWC2_39_35]KKR28504.1 MAG: hypothetical protein UT59_C0026G0006 [candidate division CPR2 bacterium GW2011_GWD1_39_7]KKR29215.1 MAG: hypothetical protein UT60_C0005G0020 [candidate division CPR2 bacterium GW2011_GWD2_39_7]KKS09141.1 MAG: hypothetical protein UU65_C0003G0196 [candidate division CPR2 bacterium GW2011_GWC1_41_48]OGB60974.1 MAG: hypothetical protein A2Y27_01920 [candidate division CPR2 bacterium G